MSAFEGLGVPLPPLLFLICLGLGGLLQRLWPRPFLPWPQTVLALLATALWLLAIGIAGFAFRTMSRARTPHHPRATPSALVTGGPFRYSRNPLYLSLLLVLAGCAVVVNSVWLLLALPALFALLSLFAVRREEATLARLFGAEYQAYRGRVRRWL